MNAMQAAAAALGIGLPKKAVVQGLRTFVLDAERNPGRANLYELEGRIVVIDYAHNEAGMVGLTAFCEGLRRNGRRIWLAICTAGDRTDQILHDFAYRAARGADHVAIAELLRLPAGSRARRRHRTAPRRPRRRRRRGGRRLRRRARRAEAHARPGATGAMSWGSPRSGCARRSSPGSRVPARPRSCRRA